MGPNQYFHDLLELVEDPPSIDQTTTPNELSSPIMTAISEPDDTTSVGVSNSSCKSSSSDRYLSTSGYAGSPSLIPSTQSSTTKTSIKENSPKKEFSRPDHLCKPCGRFFISKEALESHWIDAKRHNWCRRCNIFFPTTAARTLHCKKSHFHWICDIHDLDFYSKKDLHEHYETVESHHCCDQCDKVFDNASSLQNVSSVFNPVKTWALTNC